ncbi:MAG: DUF2807 domain-containing protein [Deltaproteobacteria bacterium]|nr:DUF2807 domain-containing protein [Deltaproteobacteria bacterium]
MRTLAPILARSVELKINGSGDIEATVQAQEIDTRIDCSASVTLRGTSDYHGIFVDGSANINAPALLTKTTEVDVDGAADCNVNAQETLNVWIDGSAKITYVGSPVVHKEIDGSGAVKQR